jgi:hypothetical protein
MIIFNLAIAGYQVGNWLPVFYETVSEEGRLVAFDMIEVLYDEIGEDLEFIGEWNDAEFVDYDSMHI